MIDFDDCLEISMDKTGVDQAVKAFRDNFFCPRPGLDDTYIDGLWAAFSRMYLSHSEYILKNVLNKPFLRHLPPQFINGVEKEVGQR